MSNRYLAHSVALLLSFGAFAISGVDATELHSDFSDGFGPWVQGGTGTWELQQVEGLAVAALTERGRNRPPVRRPGAFRLVPHHDWSNVQLSVRARTMEPDSRINRDIVLVFGYVDDTHYYYAHLSSNSDGGVHNVLMKVMGDTRETIHRESLPEARLTDDWHDLRAEHDTTGSIRVYVDDMETPLMTAQDDTYTSGAVGFGTFDDRALFDTVVVKGDLAVIEGAEMANISTRGFVNTGDEVMIAGFVVDGDEKQTVLIRAAGPALGALGVPGTISDPVLTLVRSPDGEVITANQRWSLAANADEIAMAATQVGAFAYQDGSDDAAILMELNPGGYTARVASEPGDTGISLVEVYRVN